MSDSDIIKCSSMVKRAQGKSTFGLINLRKRVFVLTRLKLCYYDGTLDKHGNLKGEIALSTVRAVEPTADRAFDNPAFQVVYGSAPHQLTLYVLASDVHQQREWVEALRELCRNNSCLADRYHPGTVNGNKYTCCSANKQEPGCEETYFKTNQTNPGQSFPTSTRATPNPYNQGVIQPSAGAIQYQSTQTYQQQLRQHKMYGGAVGRGQYDTGGGTHNGPMNVPVNDMKSRQPLEPPHENFEVVALYDFPPKENVDLPLTKGQRVTIINSSRPHWWRARSEQGIEGYVPSNYVKKVGLETEEWYFPDLTRVRAENILKEEAKEGGFVIRPSRQDKGYKYALSICHEGQVRHYHVKQDEEKNFWISEKHRFATIAELVQYHKSNGGGLVTRLRRPPDQLVPNQPSLSSMFDDKWEIDKKNLQLGKELGSGQFGRVVKGMWKGTVEVAVKMMKEGAMKEEEFVEEAQTMVKFQHPNLVTFYGVCTKQGPIYIVTELMEHGCLLTYIRMRKEIVNKTDVLVDIAIQICSAMKYLEVNHFIHRDLAARNCLVGRRNIVKVADFGLARCVADDEYTASEGTKFPIKWAAPEVISHARFSSKSDVWSYGILLWELFTAGKTPYPSFTNPQVFEEVLKGYRLPPPQSCPPQVYQLMKDCWEQSPDDRPAFQVLHMKLSQLQDHDYFEAEDMMDLSR